MDVKLWIEDEGLVEVLEAFGAGEEGLLGGVDDALEAGEVWELVVFGKG